MTHSEEQYHISAEDFAERYKNRELDHDLIIDVRELREWRMYHLERSQLIPLGTLSVRLDEIDRTKKVYLMCAHGIRSLHAADYLLNQGFIDVVNVDGGLAEVSLYLEESELVSGE